MSPDGLSLSHSLSLSLFHQRETDIGSSLRGNVLRDLVLGGGGHIPKMLTGDWRSDAAPTRGETVTGRCRVPSCPPRVPRW